VITGVKTSIQTLYNKEQVDVGSYNLFLHFNTWHFSGESSFSGQHGMNNSFFFVFKN
jgi:hypothetical protein